MYFDRGALKRRAKHLVTQGNPPAYMVTLIFLLATTALATVVGLFLPNPVDQVDALYLNWFNTIMENGGEISQGSMNALTQQIMALFQGPMATAALLVALILGFYSMVVSFGYSSYALRVMRGMEGGGYQAPFSQFHMAGKVILIAVLRMVFVYLWTLLFIVPGIIALYRYRMAEYALLDDPEISCLEAIRRSKRMMQGHKMELFVLDLSFLGWSILAGVIVALVQMLVQQVTMLLVFQGMTGVSTVVMTLVTLAANIAVNMFLVCYMTLADAGFYLYVLGNQAPPVGEGGNGTWNQGGPNNGWNQGGPNSNGWGSNAPNGWNQGGPNQPWGQNGGAPYDDGNEGWNQ